MNMTDLKEIQHQIDVKIPELRQQARFAINKYDYHHKNDEFQILEQQIEILNQVSGTYTRFLNEMEKFKEALNDAKQKSEQLDQLLAESQPTTHQEQKENQQPPNGQQHEHEMTKTSKKQHPPSSTKKDKFKDTTSKKQLFPPATVRR